MYSFFKEIINNRTIKAIITITPVLLLILFLPNKTYASFCTDSGAVKYNTGVLSSPDKNDNYYGSVNSIYLRSYLLDCKNKTGSDANGCYWDVKFHDCQNHSVCIETGQRQAYCIDKSNPPPPPPAKNCSSRVCGDCDLDACLKMPGCSVFNSNKCGFSTGCYFNIEKSTCENDTTQTTPCAWVPNSTKSNGYICEPKTSSSTPPPATTTPGPSGGGGSGTCETEDNRPLGAAVPLADKTFHCKSVCATGTEEDKTGQGALYACSGTSRCCKDKAKYSQYYGSSIGGSSTTPAPGGGTTSPGGGTSTPGGGTPGPASGPCAGVKGGVLSYVNGTCTRSSCTGASCLPEEFNAATAATRVYCGGTYKDKYICQNIDPATSQRYVDYVPSGGNTCSSPPWCPATGGTGGTTTPSPAAPDANCTAYQGQTCHPNDYSNKIYCCEPNKNLECTNPNSQFPNSYTCQYKGGVAFTPTPGASSNCVPGGYGGGIGCKCISGGGCTAGGCYPSAESTNSSDSSHWYCSQGVGTWCERSQTTVPNAAACGTATTYTSPSPSPTASVPGAYQADCPYYNASGGLTNNECQDGTQCLPGYTHAPIGPGGTNGDRVCSETNNRPNVCCTKTTGGTTTTPAPGGTTTTPAPGGGTTAPTNPPASSYTPPTSCVGHPANSMCGSASEANMQCFYPGGTGYWGWKGEGNGCDTTSGTQTHCYVCTP